MALDNFKPIEVNHKKIFASFFRHDPPDISELSFTNLFMWRHRNMTLWTESDGCLMIIMRPEGAPPYALPPVGSGDKKRALETLCSHLGQLTQDVKICRVGENFVKEHVDPARYSSVPDPDNSDYVYSARDLIELSGRKYHRKKNLLNRFLKHHTFEYRSLDMEMVECFLEMQENWCQLKGCAEKQELLSEDYAVHRVLTHFEELDYRGGAIQIDSRLEAFSLGEALNQDTAVIHVEKANPEIPGLYAAINKLFCQHAWSDMAFINREQDLGMEGLRKAKRSYNPHHMVNKFIVTPR